MVVLAQLGQRVAQICPYRRLGIGQQEGRAVGGHRCVALPQRREHHPPGIVQRRLVRLPRHRRACQLLCLRRALCRMQGGHRLQDIGQALLF